MIPKAFIDQWRQVAPWASDHQVEQDLVISRALVELFNDPFLRDRLAFRGGTALYKLHLPPARYSEDIDLVQTRAEAIGPTIDVLRGRLDAWLGPPKRDLSAGRVTLHYRFTSERRATDSVEAEGGDQQPRALLRLRHRGAPLLCTISLVLR